jgi:hypothetical protein
MALDATVGGAASDSYVTLVYADAFFAGHYSLAKASAWAALTVPQKESALRRACTVLDTIRVLDTELGSGALPIALVQRDTFDLTLHRLEFGQLLSFPRNIDLIPGTYTGYIPNAVLESQCEQAIYLLTFDESVIVSRLSGLNHLTVQAGSVRVSQGFAGSGAGGSGGATYLAPMVIEMMRPFFRKTTRIARA